MKRRDDIIIIVGDKVGAVVIQDVKLYIKEAERQLHNTENHRPLTNDPTKINNDTVNKTVKRFQKEHLIKDQVGERLKTQNPITPRFYTKSKIHKEWTPGRPVISSASCHSSKISEYVDYHLQPIVWEIPTYIKETSDFLRKLKSTTEVPENFYLVTLDVKSLDTSTPNSARDKSSKNIPWKLYEEGNSHKGNNYFLSSRSNFKQFCI